MDSISATPSQRISLSGYITHIQTYSSPSPYTIDTFNHAIHACEIDELDASPEGLSKLWAYLGDRFDTGKSKRGFIKNVLVVIKATLNFHGIVWAKDYHYNLLAAKLRHAKPAPKLAYEDSDIQKILRIVQCDHPVFNAIILMSQSALRIGGTKDLTYDQFVQTKVPGVRIFTVYEGNKEEYTGAISEYAYKLMVDRNYRHTKLVVDYDQSNSAEFGDAIRSRLWRALEAEDKLSLAKGKSMLHSFRMWSIGKMAMSEGIHIEDVSAIAGHAPGVGSRMTQHYINSNMKTPKWKEHVANIYSKTELMKWRYESASEFNVFGEKK